MLPQSTIVEVARLLLEGKLSQRKIADRLQVSRSTVGAIASGSRGLHGRLPIEREAELFVASSPPKRCPECGYRVYLPCLVCRTRQSRERHASLLDFPFFGAQPEPVSCLGGWRKRRRGARKRAQRRARARVA